MVEQDSYGHEYGPPSFLLHVKSSDLLLRFFTHPFEDARYSCVLACLRRNQIIFLFAHGYERDSRCGKTVNTNQWRLAGFLKPLKPRNTLNTRNTERTDFKISITNPSLKAK
ncbi:MAG: hypothetical protein AAB318_00945 [Planctomycetota bacterium]